MLFSVYAQNMTALSKKNSLYEAVYVNGAMRMKLNGTSAVFYNFTITIIYKSKTLNQNMILCLVFI